MSVENNGGKTASMWDTLVLTLTKEIQSNTAGGGTNLAHILRMITKSLTFDDPGLFSTITTQNSETNHRQLYVCNLWLLNQLISVYSDEKFMSARLNNVTLQMDMISAAFVKQSWFFDDVMRRFIKFLTILINLKFPTTGTSSDFNLKVFYVEPAEKAGVETECEFSTIRVPTRGVQNKYVELSVEMISHAMVLIANADPELRHEMTQVILRTFFVVDLKNKVKCVDYFVQLLKETIMMDNQMRHGLGCLLTGIHSVIVKLVRMQNQDENMGAVVEDQEVTAFLQNVVYLIMTMNTQPDLFVSAEVKVLFFETFLQTLKELFLVRSHKPFESIVSEILKFLRINLERSSNLNTGLILKVTTLSDFVGKNPEILKVLEICVLDEMQGVGVSSSWSTVLAQLDDEIGLNFITHEYVGGILKLYRHVFRAASNLKQSWGRCSVGLPPLFGAKFIDYVNFFLVLLEVVLNQKYHDLFEELIMSSAFIVSSEEFSTLPAPLQGKLFTLIVAPFHNIADLKAIYTDRHFVEELRTSVGQLSAASTRILQITGLHYLKFIMVTPHSQMDFVQSTILRLFKTILTATEFHVEIKKTIIEEYFVLVVATYAIPSDDLNKIVLTVMNDAGLTRFFTKILKNLICTVSGTAQLTVKSTNRQVSVFVRCRECDNVEPNQSATVDDRRVTLSYSVQDEMKTAFVSLLKTIFNWTGSNDPYIRYDMIQALPAILGHTDECLSSYDEDKWIGYFLDEDLDTRIMFAKQMEAILAVVEKKSTPEHFETVTKKCLEKLIRAITTCLKTANKPLQNSVLSTLKSFALCPTVTGENFVHSFSDYLPFHDKDGIVLFVGGVNDRGGNFRRKKPATNDHFLQLQIKSYKIDVVPGSVSLPRKRDLIRSIIESCKFCL